MVLGPRGFFACKGVDLSKNGARRFFGGWNLAGDGSPA